MIFLDYIELLTEDDEYKLILGEKRTYFSNFYPLRLFPQKQLERIDFDNITILYGNNGSGKSTLLNIIASKTNAIYKQEYDKGEFFNQYIDACNISTSNDKPDTIKILTSDDVFDYLFDIRSINSNIEKDRKKLYEEYLTNKYSEERNISDYDKLKKTVDSRRMTLSSYVRDRLRVNNMMEQSNGESALMFFENEIKENSIYLLDEPENSLSASSQIKLAKFLEDSARFFNCQFIISTHSPFLLALKGAKIYDLDSVPCTTRKWTELENAKIYHQFFNEHAKEFD